MRILLGLALALTLIIFTNAGDIPEAGSHPEEPEPELPNPPPGGPPPPPSPDQQATEDEPERDIAENISKIIDKISSLASLLLEGTTSTSTTSPPFPTSAYPCLRARDLFNSCAQNASSLDSAAAGSCNLAQIAECKEGNQAATTPISIYQSSCLCTQSQTPALFESYLGSCNSYVQAQTQLAAQSSLAIATAFCTANAGDVNVSPTPSAASITPPGSTTSSTTSSQTCSSTATKCAATALSPMMFSGSWNMVWWTVIMLMGSGWAGYS